jgi:ribosomal protein S3AE
MSDLNVTSAPLKSMEISKDAVVTSSKDTYKEAQPVKSESKQDKLAKQSVLTKLTDLNYSIDREDNALHLKVRSVDGEVVREVVFDRIDPSLLNPKKLKGIFVDGNS